VSIKSCRPLPKYSEGTVWETRPRLPQDLIEKAVKRLGILGLLSAVAHPLFHYSNRLVIPDEVLRTAPVFPAHLLAMTVAIGSGLAIYALTRTRRITPTFMLDLGLIFEVVGAFCIALIEASGSSARSPVDFGPGGIALWITLFVLVVPNTLGKTALAAITSASMGPIALIVAAYANGQPPPQPYLFLVVALPNLLGAAVAIILSRFVYSMGADVSKAREMGSYKLVELLGRGGMGEVWRAEHRLLARPAAIKLIQPEALGGINSNEMTLAKRRFEREAKATAMLSSPHTIHLYDFGVGEDGAFYYVMELLHGVDLQTLVDTYGPASADRVAHMLVQVCESLQEAHQNGLVHRDIKPANIYTCRYGLDYDFIKVLDFGIVKSKEDLTGRTQLTNDGGASGTPGFMAPELVLGGEVDARADIYAVGCVAYWLLTGKLVFEEETYIATMLAHANKAPTPPSKRTEIEIPPQLDELVMSCLAKDPQDRPSSAGEIRRNILRYGLADSWNAERAENWWKLHVPEKRVMGAPADAGERLLQANAKI
jgi:eukaryotic-like serine/threonine-protein kinase